MQAGRRRTGLLLIAGQVHRRDISAWPCEALHRARPESPAVRPEPSPEPNHPTADVLARLQTGPGLPAPAVHPQRRHWLPGAGPDLAQPAQYTGLHAGPHCYVQPL